MVQIGLLVLMTLPFWWWLTLRVMRTQAVTWRRMGKLALGAVLLLIVVGGSVSYYQNVVVPQHIVPPPVARIEVIAPDGTLGTLPVTQWPEASKDGYRLPTPTASVSTTPTLLPQEQPPCDEACLRRLEEEHKKLH